MRASCSAVTSPLPASRSTSCAGAGPQVCVGLGHVYCVFSHALLFSLQVDREMKMPNINWPKPSQSCARAAGDLVSQCGDSGSAYAPRQPWQPCRGWRTGSTPQNPERLPLSRSLHKIGSSQDMPVPCSSGAATCQSSANPCNIFGEADAPSQLACANLQAQMCRLGGTM